MASFLSVILSLSKGNDHCNICKMAGRKYKFISDLNFITGSATYLLGNLR